jgi:hypothetical protein
MSFIFWSCYQCCLVISVVFLSMLSSSSTHFFWFGLLWLSFCINYRSCCAEFLCRCRHRVAPRGAADEVNQNGDREISDQMSLRYITPPKVLRRSKEELRNSEKSLRPWENSIQHSFQSYGLCLQITWSQPTRFIVSSHV